MNNTNYITQVNRKKVFNRKTGYKPKYNYKRSQFYRNNPRWLSCKQRLINKRGLYLKQVYVSLHRVIIYKYMHLILMWWYILSYRYLQLLQRVHLTYLWGKYYTSTSYPQQDAGVPLPLASENTWVPVANPYRWNIVSFKAKKKGVYLRRRAKRGVFFKVRRTSQGYSRYLPPKQYALLKAFYSPSNNQGWEEKFTLPMNIVKMRRILSHPRGGFDRKKYVFINFTAFTVRGRNKSYLYYTKIK